MGRVVPPDKTQLRQGVNSTPTRGQLNSDRVDLTPTRVDLTPTRVDLTPTKRNFHTTMRFSPQHAAKFEERKHSGLKC